MQTQLFAKLKERNDIAVIENAPMKEYTSFQIGGPADILIQPETKEALALCYSTVKAEGVPVTIIGAGSNLLVGDKGIRGAVIRLTKPFSRVQIEGEMLIAEAGISLARMASEALSAGLSGLEFASGIPGTLGGAVYMNAGAYGGEMKDVVLETEYLTADGSVKTIAGKDHLFGYRKSFFSGTENMILNVKLLLKKGDPALIRETMRELNARRKEKQPLSYPSAGSTFKRPEGHFAGKLIEDAGLKGARIGGAQISEKHAGFLINSGGATATDVRQLIEHVQAKVLEKFGVTLEPEIRFLGEFTD